MARRLVPSPGAPAEAPTPVSAPGDDPARPTLPPGFDEAARLNRATLLRAARNLDFFRPRNEELSKKGRALLAHLGERRLQARVAVILGLRVQGYTTTEIAAATGWSKHAVQAVLHRARTSGVLDDVKADLQGELLPLAIDALRRHLEAGDLEAALETLKGTGYFRQYHEGPGRSGGDRPTALNLFVVSREGGGPDVTVQPVVVGKPREEGSER
jgi:hypothetical protein